MTRSASQPAEAGHAIPRQRPPAPDVARARARLAGLSNHPNNPRLPEARRDLAFANLAEHLKTLVAGSPPITQEQRDQLTQILRRGGQA